MQNQDELNTNSTINDIVTAGLVQHVDLSRFIPRQQKVYLPFNQILQICLIMSLVITAYSFYGHWQQTVIKKHIISLQVQSNELMKQMGSSRLKKLQELASGDIIYAAVKAAYAKNGTGFSNYLSAIAASCPNGVWLTSIEIKRRSNNTILSGKAYHTNNIMQLVENLNRDGLFSSTPFFLERVEKVAKPVTKVNEKTPAQQLVSPVIYNFVLRTKVTPVIMETKT